MAQMKLPASPCDTNSAQIQLLQCVLVTVIWIQAVSDYCKAATVIKEHQ